MKTAVALPLLLAIAGCSAGDPAIYRLKANTQAVTANPPEWGTGDVFIGVLSPSNISLDMGDLVTVTEDRGYLYRTQGDIDEDIERSIARKAPKDLIDMLRSEKPGKYEPPDIRAANRPVKIVVESGKHKGATGSIERCFLRPIE